MGFEFKKGDLVLWGENPDVHVFSGFSEIGRAWIRNLNGDSYLSVGAETLRPHRPEEEDGEKFDAGKRRWSLVPWKALGAIVDVLGYGAEKYSPDNWQKVSSPKRRYADAHLRHITAWMGGERNDPESGLHHLAHAGCCILFLLWFELKGEADGNS